MPRQNRSPSVPRKIGKHTAEEIKTGLNLIRSGTSIQQAARTTGIPFTTLKSYHNKTKTCESLENERLEPNYSANRIFTLEQEQTLKDYFNRYGLTKKEGQEIAFQYAKINNLKIPQSWLENQRAGKDWLMAFIKRHDITLRKPEPCSPATTTEHTAPVAMPGLENLLLRATTTEPTGTVIFHPLPIGQSSNTDGANTSDTSNVSTSLRESPHRQPQQQQMVSKYIRKTSNASFDEDIMRLAMEEAKKSSLKAAARKYGINLSTLQRHVKKGCPKIKLGRYRTIFTETQENELLKLCQTDSLDGLTRKEFLMIAYKYAKAKNICNPFKNGTAGTDWYKGFEKRHPGLKFPCGKPNAGSNKVQKFCELLEKVKVEDNVKVEAGSQDEKSRIVSSEKQQETMPRKYTTKEGSKKRKPVDKEKLKTAVAAVLDGNTIKGTSKKYGVPLMTLKRYARRQKESKEEIDYELNSKKSQILTDAEEKDLATHLETASNSYNLTQKKIRTLAYQFVKSNNKKMPANWEVKKEAGYDWFRGFMQRQKSLKPKATSLSRAIKEELSYAPTQDQQDQMIGPTQQKPKQQQQQQQKQQQPQKQHQPKQLRVYNKTFEAQPGPSTAVLEEQDDDDDEDSDSEESCSMEHEVGIITEPLTGIQDPLANNPDRCRFCANVTKCVDAIHKPYLKNNKMTVILNDIKVEIDLKSTQKVCLDCDRKLLEMYCFVTLVKNAQDTLLNASYDTEETETLIVKTECESPTPDDNDEIDETKEGIVDLITIGETAFVKNDVFMHKKRKSDKDNKKTSKPQKKRKVDDKVTCESTEVVIAIKEEPIERDDDAITDIHKAADSEDRDTGPDIKLSELDIATNVLLNEMAGDGVS